MNRNDEEIEPEFLRMEKWEKTQELLASHFHVTTQEIFDGLLALLSDKYEFEWGGDILNVDIEYEKALKLLLNFDFNVVLNQTEPIDLDLPPHLVMRYKVRVKSKGLIWVIHKYDVDPFPSNPHAHQLDNNIKLDLSNGRCYRLKKHLHTISKRDLLFFREKAQTVFKGVLPELTI